MLRNNENGDGNDNDNNPHSLALIATSRQDLMQIIGKNRPTGTFTFGLCYFHGVRIYTNVFCSFSSRIDGSKNMEVLGIM